MKFLSLLLVSLTTVCSLGGLLGPAEVTPTPAPISQTQLAPTPPAAAPTQNPRAFEDGQPLAARVNEQPIYLAAFEQHVAAMAPLLSGDPNDAIFRQQMLDALIEQVLIEQEAAARGLTIEQADLDAAVRDNQPADQAQLDRWLQANSLSYEGFEAQVRTQLLTARLIAATETPDTAPQIRLRYILVRDQVVAAQLIEQLKNGAAFTTLAEEASLDEASRANGGDLGWFPQGVGVLPAEVEAIAFKLELGEISGPIQTGSDLYIIKLEEKAEAQPLSEPMRHAIQQQNFLDWLQTARSAAAIEIYIAL